MNKIKKSELESGMIIRTVHARYGVVELERNRIHICYDPTCIYDEDQYYEMLSLDDVFEYDDGKLGVGCIVSKEKKEKYPDFYKEYKVGEICIVYEIVAVYKAEEIYEREEGLSLDILVE